MNKLIFHTFAITGITGTFYFGYKYLNQGSCCYFPREKDPSQNILRIGTSGHIQCLKKYIKSGSDVNQKDPFEYTLMHWAVIKQNLEWGELLVKSSPSIVNIKGGYWGNTPLHFASSENKEFVQFLISSGASINAQNDEGNTPLHNALISQKEENAEILRQAGADPKIKNIYGKTAREEGICVLHDNLKISKIFES